MGEIGRHVLGVSVTTVRGFLRVGKNPLIVFEFIHYLYLSSAINIITIVFLFPTWFFIHVIVIRFTAYDTPSVDPSDNIQIFFYSVCNDATLTS